MTRTHIAFRSHDRATVNQFYAVALTAGGKDNGAPGLRPDHGTTSYAAFNNVELVSQESA